MVVNTVHIFLRIIISIHVLHDYDKEYLYKKLFTLLHESHMSWCGLVYCQCQAKLRLPCLLFCNLLAHVNNNWSTSDLIYDSITVLILRGWSCKEYFSWSRKMNEDS